MLRLSFILLKHTFVNLPLKSNYYHKQLPNQVNQVLKLIKREKSLNEKCFLLEHLSDLMIKDRKIYLSSEQRKIVSEQLNKWKISNQREDSNQKGRFQHIATVAWVIKKLNLQKIHEDLYKQIEQRFLDDEWYVNFDQSVKALQVFKSLPDSKEKEQILRKIERNVGLTMWNVNMKYYERIATSLLEAGRLKSELWGRMETQILENLDMHYQTKTLCDIFKAYALSKNGNNVFYQMMQKVLFQGHFSQFNQFNHKNFAKQYDSSGDFFSLIIETYAIAQKSCGVILTPDFKQYVYESFLDSKTEYQNLSSVTRVIRSLQGFQFQPAEIEEIQEIILNQKPKQLTISEIKQFYELMIQRHGQIPHKIHQYIQQKMMKEIQGKYIPAVQLVDFTNYLLENQYLVNQKQYLKQVNSFLEGNFKYLHKDEAKYVIAAIQKARAITNNQSLLMLPTQQKKPNNLEEHIF